MYNEKQRKWTPEQLAEAAQDALDNNGHKEKIMDKNDSFLAKVEAIDIIKRCGHNVSGIINETVEGVLALVGEVLPALPNGVKIFNSTPHPIRFWDESWSEPVEVPSHVVLNAEPAEVDAGTGPGGVQLVRTQFNQTNRGRITLSVIPDNVVVIGSFIAAQAYPGRVVAMTPCAGYERVAPAEKRMRPDKFTTF